MRKLLGLILVSAMLTLPVRAEDAQHSDGAKPAAGGTQAAGARPDGDADKVFKEKAVDFFSTVFAPVPKSVIQSEYGDKLPAAAAAAKEGNGKDLSDILTPLFGTLDTPSFTKLMDAVEKKIKDENGTSGTVDNKFIDLLELVKKYGKDGVLDEKTSKTEKEKAVGDKFRADFLAQQQKNKDLLAKTNKINDLKKGGKAESAAEIAKLQDEVGRGLNQKALLSFMQTRGQVGKDLRDALAIKSQSGHNFLNATLANGQAIKLHLGNDAATADKVMAAYADKLGNWTFSPNPAANAKDFFVDALGKPAEGTPAGFQFTPPAQVADTTQQPPARGNAGNGGNTGNAGSGNKATDVASVIAKLNTRCNTCHADVTVSGNSLASITFKRNNRSFSPADVVAKANRMPLTAEDIATLNSLK